jgi:large subunit ribosomal protein L23
MHPLEVLRRPVVTEKSTLLQEQEKYAFEVAPKANKQEVRAAVERAFDVSVSAVNIVRTRGKLKRRGSRLVPTRSWKKAIVTLKAGQKIDFFEGA